jgi:hypothetical protein
MYAFHWWFSKIREPVFTLGPEVVRNSQNWFSPLFVGQFSLIGT